jgi:type I restriction enzyme S subunit
VTTVGDLIELAYGKALKAGDRSGGSVPVVGSGGVVGTHTVGITSGQTIVIGRKGSIGSVTWVDGPAWPIDTAYYVKPKTNDLDLRWSYWMLDALPLASMNKSAAVPGLNRDDVYRIPVTVPSTTKQRRIAAILDRADAIRAKRRQILAHIDSLIQATFVDMFGGVKTTRTLSSLVDEFRYGTSNKSGTTGLPTLRIPNVIGGGIDHNEIKTVAVTDSERNRLALRDGDLLFVRTNGNPDNVGRCAAFRASAVVDAGFSGVPWIFASYLIRARLRDPAAAPFLSTYLATPAGRRHLRDRAKTSAGQYNVNIDSIGSLPIPDVDPSGRARFAAHLDRLEAHRTQARKSLATDNELFASLQSRAFRGEL